MSVVIQNVCGNPKSTKHSEHNDVQRNSAKSVNLQQFIMGGLLTIISNGFFVVSCQKY